MFCSGLDLSDCSVVLGLLSASTSFLSELMPELFDELAGRDLLDTRVTLLVAGGSLRE